MRAHHDSGWQRFCELYAPLVTYWCHRSRLSAADTEDVVQEIFLNVYHHITQFGPRQPRPGSFRRWLRAVAQHTITEQRRCQRRQVRAVAESDMDQPLADTVPAPAQAEPDAEERRILYHRALELIRPEVSSRSWQAFRQTAIEGRAAADVAADLGMSPSAVYLARARVVQRLRQLVGELLA
jgi:RNA polymerase sigma-70 factor, ECF subfamily